MASFVYVDGDSHKTPVDPTTQPAGTQLILVTDNGRDIHYIAGLRVVNDANQQKSRFVKGNTNMKNRVSGES